jgi:hypothetical protein
MNILFEIRLYSIAVRAGLLNVCMCVGVLVGWWFRYLFMFSLLEKPSSILNQNYLYFILYFIFQCTYFFTVLILLNCILFLSGYFLSGRIAPEKDRNKETELRFALGGGV